jgi:hypothetical protein
VRPRKYFARLAAVAALSIFVSACALPPIVTAITVSADIFSLAGTGKTVTDNGISLVMRQDCALLRALDGSVCKDFAPSENTPEGALVAMNPLSDPTLDPSTTDPITVPHSLAYLDQALGLAVASGPAGGRDLPALAFADVGDEPLIAGGFADRDGLTYLSAGIGG